MHFISKKRDRKEMIHQLRQETIGKLGESERNIGEILSDYLSVIQKLKGKTFDQGIKDYKNITKRILACADSLENQIDRKNVIDHLKKEVQSKLGGSQAEKNIAELLLQYLTSIQHLKGEAFFKEVEEYKKTEKRILPYADTHAMKRLHESSYENAVGHCISFAEEKSTLTDKKKVYAFYQTAIRENIKYDYLTRLLYGYDSIKLEICESILPSYYYLDNKKTSVWAHMEEAEFDLNLACFVSAPDRFSRMDRFIFTSTELKTSANSYVYYEGIDIGFAFGDGKHRLAVKNLQGKKIVAKVFDVTKMYPYLETDGCSWIDIFTGKKIKDVFDFRIAILYELSRRAHNLTNHKSISADSRQ